MKIIQLHYDYNIPPKRTVLRLLNNSGLEYTEFEYSQIENELTTDPKN